MNIKAVPVSVILSFEEPDEENNTQEIYYCGVIYDPTTRGQKALEETELYVISQILNHSVRDLDTLVKISLSYVTETEPVMQYLIRNKAKYYFQPNQREDFEQRLVDGLGIATKTKDF